MNVSKTLLVVINGVYFILSIALFVSGSLVLHEYFYGRSSLLSKYAVAGSAVSMSIGGLILFLAISTLIGIYFESKRVLYFCIGVLMVIFGFEIGATICGYFMQTDALKLIMHWLHSTQINYVSSYNSSETWDSIQRHVQCCGVDSYKDWYKYLNEFNVPDSCCINSTVGCGQVAVNRTNVFTTGCRSAIYKWSSKQQITLIILYPILFLLQLASYFLFLLIL